MRAMRLRPLLPAFVLALGLAAGCETPPAETPASGDNLAQPAPTEAAAKTAAAPEAPTAPKPEDKPAITIQQLLDVHKANGARAIDGQRFLFLSDAPGTPQIFTSTAPADPAAAPAAPTQITSYPDRVSGMRVAPGGKAAIFLKDTGGDENDQIFLLDLTAKDKPAQQFTSAPKVKHTMPVFLDDGRQVAFTSNARNGKDMDLYVGALGGKVEDFAKKPLVELAGSHTVADAHGSKVIVVEARSGFDQDLWLVDIKTKAKKLLTKHTGDERWGSPHFTRDGKAILVLTDAGREHLGLVALDVASGKRTEVLALDNDIQDISVPDYATAKAATGTPEDIAAISVNKDGIEEVHVLRLDAARKVVDRKPAGLSGVIGGINVSPAGDAAFVTLEQANLPPEVFRVDLGKGTSARVTKSDHAGIDESKLVKAELLTMKSYDGRPVSMFYYQKPAAAGEKRPVVISVHGGPEGQAQPVWNPLNQYLALAGYAVAAPNVRGSTGYGKSFSHLDDVDKREDSVRDLSEVGKFIAARPDVDPARIALLGGSYGGYMVLAGLTLYPEQWAAGVDIVGIANFRTFLEQTAPYRRALREAEYGSLEKHGALLDKLSPIHKVDRIKAPLMIVHGTRDPRVPIGEARQIAEAVKKRGLPSSLLTFEDEGHGVVKRKNRLVAYPAIVDFLDKHVKHKPSAPKAP